MIIQASKKIYASILRLLPDSVHRFIIKVLLGLKIKPSVNPSDHKCFGDKGTIVISADFELAWASRYSKTKKDYLAIAEQERKNVPVIIKIAEKYNIPITWATVGHLFLEECKIKDNVKHSDILHPIFFSNNRWRFDKGDWYDDDPCTDFRQDPLWYAPDLIDAILKSPVKHEIACHTFSHIDFAGCSSDVANSEMQKFIELASKKGIKVQSMIFPGGFMGNFEVLKQWGIIAYRKQMKFEIDIPQKDTNDLISIPQSYTIGKPMFFGRQKFCIFFLKKMIKKTIKSKKLLHLSFHPSMDKWYVQNILTWLFEYIEQLRREEKLNIYTMEQVAEIFLENERSK